MSTNPQTLTLFSLTTVRTPVKSTTAFAVTATVLVYCDGTNFVNGLSGSTGNFSIAGALSVTSTTNLGGALTYGNVALANSVTGTGSMVLSASPTFTGTPIAPTPANGTNTTQIATTAFVLANGLPSGVIVLWSGSIANIPSGWVLCDGSNSTPDLRDRFVVGAGSTYAVNTIGGSANAIVVSHTHSITDPGHNHLSGSNGDIQSATWNPFGYDAGFRWDGAGQIAGAVGQGQYSNTNTTGITINTTGSSATNANLPPYYALAYIMKA